MRREGAAVLAAVLALTLAGCGRQDRPQSGKLNVVCTLFPYYDFVRQIGGEDVTPVLLIPAGRWTYSCWCPPGGRHTALSPRRWT